MCHGYLDLDHRRLDDRAGHERRLDAAWQWIRALPLIVQAIVWLLFLPVVGALWIRETTWPIVVRLPLVLGLAWWNLLIFLPSSGAAKP
jgi:hypothetical protein